MPSIKKSMHNRDLLRISNSGSYSYVNESFLKRKQPTNLKDTVSDLEKATQNTNFNSRLRMSYPAPPLTREELGLPSEDVSDFRDPSSVCFFLTSRETELIQQFAEDYNIPYEKMVARAIHDGLELLAANCNLAKKYKK